MKRAIVIAHRTELLEQAAKKIEAVTGHKPEFEQGERTASSSRNYRASPVVVASIQSLISGRKCNRCNGGKKVLTDVIGIQMTCPDCIDGIVRRIQRFSPSEFALCVIDEAHHAVSKSYQLVINYLRRGGTKIVGVTATPDRSDELALGQVFDKVSYTMEMYDAIQLGWLVPIKQFEVSVSDIDLNVVPTKGGDLSEKELAQVMEQEEVVHGVVNGVIKHAGDRPTLVFCTSVAQAHTTAEVLNRYRQNCAIALDGKTDADERATRIYEFGAGRYQFLVNCMLFTEGFDCPSVACVANARPTKSRSLYTQIVGRGTRPLNPPKEETPEARQLAISNSYKPDVLVLDFVGNPGRHKLVNPIDILGGKYPEDVKKLAREIAKNQEVDTLSALDQAAEQIRETKLAEERKRAAIAAAKKAKATANANVELRAVDPFNVLQQTDMSRNEYKPKPTDSQVEFLIKHYGMKPHELSQLSQGDAGKLIVEMKRRWRLGLASAKQVKVLARSYEGVQDLTFSQASELMTLTVQNNWRPVNNWRERIGIDIPHTTYHSPDMAMSGAVEECPF
jgi:superfamily II DNA or RNA helicase